MTRKFRPFLPNLSGKHESSTKLSTKGGPLTAVESVSVVVSVACAREIARLIGTHRVHVTASIVDSTLVHIFKSHKVCSYLSVKIQLHEDK